MHVQRQSRELILVWRLFIGCMATATAADATDWPGQTETSQAEIQFAGGAVGFSVDPQAWTIGEVPDGRRIALVLSRTDEVPRRLSDLNVGVWIIYEHDVNAQDDQQALSQRLARGIARRMHKSSKTSSKGTENLSVDGRDGLSRAFELNWRPSANDNDDDLEPLVGFHAVVPMESGWLSFHCVSPESQADETLAAGRELLAAIKLSQPAVAESAVDKRLAVAAPIIGRWKSLRAVLEFNQDGQVSLRFDHRRGYRLDELNRLDYANRVAELTGNFAPQGDGVVVTWEDGSRMNINWRIDRGDLFLTDHEGRVSHLKRIFR